ncbi:hypothetical protein Pmani_008907 [Petrolisthes manimaculis]|uniref:Uncharacterized protein n=1 Tax=Petrolisthes manimaculis TaxID=1843537 RepID=A0AAE1Q5W8_9EUCA|nr:hypothetical protein Pmani_008907 [Petrolisthes manimaculis]
MSKDVQDVTVLLCQTHHLLQSIVLSIIHDDNGCPKCQCDVPPPSRCEEIRQCPMFCNIIHDDNGCPKCHCDVPTPPIYVKRSATVQAHVGLSVIREDVSSVTVQSANKYKTVQSAVVLLKIITDVLNVIVMDLLLNVLKLNVIIHVNILKMPLDVLSVIALCCVLE